MPGGGGLKAASYTYKAARKDGTFLLMIVQNIAVNQAMEAKTIRYDAPQFNYIGRFTDNTALAVGWVPRELRRSLCCEAARLSKGHGPIFADEHHSTTS